MLIQSLIVLCFEKRKHSSSFFTLKLLNKLKMTASITKEMRIYTREIHRISDDLVNAKLAFGKLLIFPIKIKF